MSSIHPWLTFCLAFVSHGARGFQPVTLCDGMSRTRRQQSNEGGRPTNRELTAEGGRYSRCCGALHRQRKLSDAEADVSRMAGLVKKFASMGKTASSDGLLATTMVDRCGIGTSS